MILVVDDDPLVVETLKIWLKSAGYDVEAASNGAEAYAMAVRPDCECMVLDVNMPGINGPALLLVLQADNLTTPAIVITGQRGFTRNEMAQFENVAAFFHKPVEETAFLEAVKSCVRDKECSFEARGE